MADNHVYLLVYFPLAAALALSIGKPDEILARQCRWLVAAVFGFAILWKIFLTPEFIDGTFFRVTFQTDPRFEGFMLSVVGITPEQLEINREFLMNPLPAGLVPLDASPYVEPKLLSPAVTLFVWATLIIESLLFAAFAAPSKPWVVRIRHISLLGFCVGTYAIAPVPGFGWILLTLGVAQLTGSSKMKIPYIMCFMLLLFYRETAWRELLFPH